MEQDVFGNRIRAFGWLVFFLCLLICVWIVVSSIITSRTTGFLSVTSKNPKARLIISQNNRQALAIGTGKAKVRLKPGAYQVTALSGDKQVSATIKVYERQTASLSLNPSKVLTVPSAESIDFKGMDAIVNVGLSPAQINSLEEGVFQYKPTAQTVVIDSSSVVSAPYDPTVVEPFVIHFNLTIDSTPFKATISYTGTEDYVTLYLYNTSGKQVFDSANYSKPLSGE